MKNILLTLLIMTVSAFGEFRIWEDISGNIWEGEFITMNGDMVVIMNHEGDKQECEVATLSENDLSHLEKIIPPKLSLEVSKVSDGSSTGNSEKVRCRAIIKKTDTRVYTGELTAVLVMLAQEQKTGSFSRAGSSKEFKFILPEKYGVPVEFESASVSLSKSSSKKGKIYAGYVFVVWDRFGNAIAVKSNRDSFIERATKLARPKGSLRLYYTSGGSASE